MEGKLSGPPTSAGRGRQGGRRPDEACLQVSGDCASGCQVIAHPRPCSCVEGKAQEAGARGDVHASRWSALRTESWAEPPSPEHRQGGSPSLGID